MTKEEQNIINFKVELMFAQVFETRRAISSNFDIVSKKQLRHCQAYVVKIRNKETNEISYALKSYATYVAYLADDILYDGLRFVYDYTATSCQHIAKFRCDYCHDGIKYTWR